MKNGLRLLLILMMCIFAIGCGNGKKSDVESGDVQTTTTDTDGQEPYVLEFESVTIDGEKITSDCFADSKLTMINIWGTYCGPCLSEMPDLGEIAAIYDKSEFQMIGVVCDVGVNADKEAVDNVKALVEETKATSYTHVLLSDSLTQNLVSAVYYVPTTFFFNQKGECLGYVESAQPKSAWEGVIKKLLAELE